jgi:predicted metalloprotease with PDZ domain
MLRAGVTQPRDFFRMIAEDWPKYATRPGRNETPLDELSFEAWIKQYKPSEIFVNRAVSYYEKGLWTGMALDLELRLATGGRRGLPEMFRWIWDRFGRTGRAVDEATVRDAAAAISGRRFDRFFDSYVRGLDDLALPALWRRAGLRVAPRAEWDESAKPPGDRDRTRARRARAWTGIALHPERTLVRNVIPDSPAWRAGITFNDDIIAVDGARVNPLTFAKRVGDRDPGDRVRITYFRRDLLREATLTLVESPERALSIDADSNASKRAAAARAGWLGQARRA